MGLEDAIIRQDTLLARAHGIMDRRCKEFFGWNLRRLSQPMQPSSNIYKIRGLLCGLDVFCMFIIVCNKACLSFLCVIQSFAEILIYAEIRRVFSGNASIFLTAVHREAMWHEARRQEKQLRARIVDCSKRAEKRRRFYDSVVSCSAV